ncbi:NAD(P)/FAD-dependent oxidoreductase [Cellulomonas humilata]|uniref:2-polyprenyl-6-methoxyphenol hydroxylase-like FAD-dependent oxidoreductase n=1 Tax=Cellulomonas humilata TaxID=144055 RepID=A0ABU0EM80_9CELL|nr:hypothetical protein [Cellulomonas humilata]MDQ0375922.1 2-polyprenyl-6-methoxyphenol hydroxylase-like FAD-dependent oxidoreductase [Cellulomonas humilata]
MGRRRPSRVVVLGAGLAGAFAAAAAAAPGRTVTLVERDVLPTEPAARPGVPQGRLLHVYLHRGLLAIEELLPGFRGEMQAAGAVSFDSGDLAWLGEFGWGSTGRRQFPLLSATRPLVEHVVLERVRALPGVVVRDGVRVQRLRRGAGPDEPAWWVDGVAGSDAADGAASDERLTLAADLLVDATGRSSRLPVWLAAAGVRAAEVSEVDAHIGYAARRYAMDGVEVVPPGVVVLQTPRDPAGGIALPVEDGRWLVGAIGAGDLRPPRDAEGFTRFLDGLRHDAVAQLARAGTPEGDVVVHRQTGNRRHHYERVRDWPPGLLVVGDALCAFNPVYGQGVTVAACEALVLRDALRRGLAAGDERRILRRFVRVAALPWAVATSSDLRYSTDTRPSPLQALLGRWTQELDRLTSHGDVLAQSTVARVYHLMASPLLLVRPGLLRAALRARRHGYGPAVPAPEVITRTATLPDHPRVDTP